jgi:hypothetical protein
MTHKFNSNFNIIILHNIHTYIASIKIVIKANYENNNQPTQAKITTLDIWQYAYLTV